MRLVLLAALVLTPLLLRGAPLCRGVPPHAEVGIWRLNPKAASADQALVLLDGTFAARLLGEDKPLYTVVFYAIPNPHTGKPLPELAKGQEHSQEDLTASACVQCQVSSIVVCDEIGQDIFSYTVGNFWGAERRETADGEFRRFVPEVVGDPVKKTTLTTKFFEPSGVRKLHREGPPTIIVHALHGWNPFLYLFRWKGEKFADISGRWGGRESFESGVEFRDVDADGNLEVLVPHLSKRDIAQYGAQPSVYRWNELEGKYALSKKP